MTKRSMLQFRELNSVVGLNCTETEDMMEGVIFGARRAVESLMYFEARSILSKQLIETYIILSYASHC